MAGYIGIGLKKAISVDL